MIFMSKEGIYITFPRLARYIHTGEQLDIILKIVKFRGGYLISSQMKQSLVVLMYCVIECSCSASDAVYNTFLILHFPHVFCRHHSFYHPLGHYLFGFK